MPGKIFAKKYITTTTWEHLYTNPAGKEATVSINVSNFNNVDINVSLALTTASALPFVPNEDTLFLNQIVYGNNTRQFLGIILPENTTLAVKSNYHNTSVLVYGYEEDV